MLHSFTVRKWYEHGHGMCAKTVIKCEWSLRSRRWAKLKKSLRSEITLFEAEGSRGENDDRMTSMEQPCIPQSKQRPEKHVTDVSPKAKRLKGEGK